jgi:hypothetical protein
VVAPVGRDELDPGLGRGQTAGQDEEYIININTAIYVCVIAPVGQDELDPSLIPICIVILYIL